MRARSGLVAICLASTVPASLARAEMPDDARKHIGVSASIAAGGYVLARGWTGPAESALVGLGGALAVGAAKEAADALGAGTPSWSDVGWDLAGAALGVIAAWLLDPTPAEASSDADDPTLALARARATLGTARTADPPRAANQRNCATVLARGCGRPTAPERELAALR